MTEPCPYRRVSSGQPFCAVAEVRGKGSTRNVGALTCEKCPIPAWLAEHPCNNLDFGTSLLPAHGGSHLLDVRVACRASALRVEDIEDCTPDCPDWSPTQPDKESQESVVAKVLATSALLDEGVDKELFHPEIVMRCKTRFDQGFFEDAVFNACKLFEDRTREILGEAPDVIGVNLITKAYHPQQGEIPIGNTPAEQEGFYFLARGLIQFIKNPSSHRFVDYSDDKQVLKILSFLDVILRWLEVVARTRST